MRGAVGGANLLALRSHNAALVLDLLRTAGAEGISRLELAERTGLTPQAVSKITARLREDGLAAEAGRRASTGGKPRTVLRLVPEAGHALGVHLDRDELRAVLVDLDGTVLGERRSPLDLGAGAEAVLEGVAGAARELVADVLRPPVGAVGAVGAVVDTVRPPVGTLDDTPRPPAGAGALADAPTLLGLGVALPGPLDHVRGVLHRVTGFPEWDGFPLRDALVRRLGVPVVVDKDTNAAALGLAVGGEGPGGGGSFAYLHLGTGLGAGLVIGGGVHRGARTGAGEFGHQVVQLDGPPCTCGARGCIEALCLGAVARGDLTEAARVLGAGAANLAGLLDIDLVLLGGRTVAAAPEAFVGGVGAVLDARARREGGHGGAVPVRMAPGGVRGVAEGAAQLLLAPLFGRGDV
ncbi:putative transcriptional regulatory protein [Streptomyces ambofaciens ATCC 23877]|uniref:Putative transcriptional regulatory protein n=1 Tax=Streptomyces ambofaciens (strain ATCC 23877 / 3486 / DSM 40053 / JCM 4204 / NBRC 12836 / NRRL B-2516) TaxID=278992 RepID=A0A0K2ASY8_STRA7|nr:ROK family transcriptional regulator [Streptomyces ambofaciens]AKZ55947.1 putative transcriptional regulatory protein [Streptomyces ambofaciens ATCC 23877]